MYRTSDRGYRMLKKATKAKNHKWLEGSQANKFIDSGMSKKEAERLAKRIKEANKAK